MSVTAIIGVGIGVLALGSLGRALSPLFNLVSQQAFKTLPNELLPPVNLINLRYRGLMTESGFKGEMEKQGINAARATMLYEGSEMLLSGYETVMLWRRGHLDEAKRNEILETVGFTEERIEYLVKVTEEIPSARDVIAFAVREVYSPQIAEAFGQYEGVDEVLREAKADISATGMTEDAFRKFWAAHWILPSMNQGYEMMHREIITAKELNQLMVAMDIMPWWREKLSAMSYATFTRVDVRRMHKLGLIDEGELVKAYKDTGYDEEKAKKLTEFTIDYNKEPMASEATETDIATVEEKSATRAAVIKAYRNALITLEQTKTYLGDLEYTPEAIDLYIASEDYALAEDILDDKLKIISDAYVRRIYDYNKAIELLGTLNLPAAQVDALMVGWNTERDARASRPSKAELFKMEKQGIISKEILRVELAAHGFSDRYVTWYLELNK